MRAQARAQGVSPEQPVQSLARSAALRVFIACAGARAGRVAGAGAAVPGLERGAEGYLMRAQARAQGVSPEQVLQFLAWNAEAVGRETALRVFIACAGARAGGVAGAGAAVPGLECGGGGAGDSAEGV